MKSFALVDIRGVGQMRKKGLQQPPQPYENRYLTAG